MPGPGPLQTLYLKIGPGDLEMDALRVLVDDTCALAGLGHDPKPGLPHATLGRVRQPSRIPGADLQRLAEAVEGLQLDEPICLSVHEVRLVLSDWNNKDQMGRPTHSTVATWALKGK